MLHLRTELQGGGTTEPEQPEQPGGDDAETVVYTLTPVTNSSNSDYTKNYDTTINNIIWNVSANMTAVPWKIGGKSITSQERTIYSKSPLNKNISKIEITHGKKTITVNSLKVIVATDANFANVVSTLTPTYTDNSSVTVERPANTDWSNCYYKFVYNVTNSSGSNQYLEFSEAKFTGK